MNEGFLMDIDAALLFFRACKRFNLPPEDEAGRRRLMGQLIKRKKVKYLRDVRAAIKNKKIMILKEKDLGRE